MDIAQTTHVSFPLECQASSSVDRTGSASPLTGINFVQASSNENLTYETVSQLDDLIMLLQIGMYERFAMRFNKLLHAGLASSSTDVWQLAESLNSRLRAGKRASNLRLTVSHGGGGEPRVVTVIGSSSLFGETWPVAKLSFDCLAS